MMVYAASLRGRFLGRIFVHLGRSRASDPIIHVHVGGVFAVGSGKAV